MLLVFFFFAFLTTSIVADVSLSKPGSGLKFTVSGGSVSIEITWSDDGGSPSIKDLESLTFTLCTGLNLEITAVTTIGSQLKPTDSSYTASIPASVGASGVYFIQIYAQYPSGTSIHYLKRFQLNGMTGLAKASGSLDDAPPAAQTAVTTAKTTVDPTATMDVTKSFLLPYTEQTGIIRFAPMQLQPGLTITATTWSMKYQTSAVTYFLSPLGAPKVQSTVTPGWSYTRTSFVNGVAGLGVHTDAYPPLKVLKLATMSKVVKRFF